MIMTEPYLEHYGVPGMTRIGDRVSDSYLYHYGVPGMKWGRRKARPVSTRRQARAKRDNPNPNYSKRQMADDKLTYGKRGVRNINRSMNKGLSREKAQKRETGRQIGIGAATFVGLTAAAVVAQGALDSWLDGKASPSASKPRRSVYQEGLDSIINNIGHVVVPGEVIK